MRQRIFAVFTNSVMHQSASNQSFVEGMAAVPQCSYCGCF
jgi:hypothetical protein